MMAELLRTDAEQIEQEFFRRIHDTAPVMTRVAGADGQCLYMSPQWLEFTGQTMAQELVMEPGQGVHPDDSRQFVDTYLRAFQTRQSFQLEYRRQRADGQYRWLLERAAPWIGQDDEFAGFVVSCFDITDQHRCQDDLQLKNDELKQLLQQRGEALSIANARLRQDIIEQKQTEHRLVEQQNQLRMLASEVTVAQERERRRIALGLHDEIGQVLALTRLKIGELLELQTDAREIAQINDIRELLDQAARATRSATFELSSPLLHELGLKEALQRLGDECEKRDGIEFHFKPRHDLTSLADRTRIVVYRAVRELLFNIEKHAQARQATLTIQKAGQFLQFVVEDDGIGTDSACIGRGFGPTGGFGLFSIGEQIKGIGGQLEILSSPGAGTRVVVVVPLA